MENNDSFLGDDYIAPKKSSDYLKLEIGDNTIRILSKPLIGWSFWSLENKPVRIAGLVKPTVDKNLIKQDQFGFQDTSHFWAVVVFDYKTNEIKIYEITKLPIINRITELSKNPAWGSPFGYDLIINVKKEAKKTIYTVTPNPPKPVSDLVKAAFKAKPCKLSALLVGGNPFEVTPGNNAPVQPSPVQNAPFKQEPTHDESKSLTPDPEGIDPLPF